MSLGTLTAVVDAETRGFVQGMANAAARMESFAREAKKVARDIAQVSLGMVAFAAAAVRMAAGADAGVGRAVASMKGELMALAIQIAQIVLPAVHQLTLILKSIADYLAGLSPEMKKHISDWALLALEVAGAALVLGKVATLVQAVMLVFEGLAAVIGAIGIGTLGVILVVLVAIAAAVAFVHKAWRENWGGIQEKTASVIKAMSGYWNDFKTWLTGNFFDWFIDQWAMIEKAIAHAMNFLKNPLDEKARGYENEKSDKTIAAWAEGMKGGAIGKQLEIAWEKAKDVVDEGVQEWKLIFKEIGAAVKGILPSSSGGHARVPTAMGDPKDWASWDDAMKERKQQLDDLNQLFEAENKAREEEAALQKAASEKLASGIAAAVSHFLSKLGDLGTVMSSAMQGFQSGGIWGAIIAVFIELLSRFKRFQELIDIGNGQIQIALQEMAGAFGDFIDGVKPLMGAIGMIAHVVHGILSPIISFIGKLLGSLAPVIALISVVLVPLANSLQTLFDIIGQTLGPAFEVLNAVATALAMVFLGLNEAVLWVKAGLLELVRFLDHTFNPTGNHSGVDQAAADAWASLHNNEQQMKNIADHGLAGLANSSAEAAGAVGRLGDTADQVSRQLTNIPQGFNTMLREWQASFATSSTAGGDSERDSFRQTGNATKSSSSSYHRGKNKNDTSDL